MAAADTFKIHFLDMNRDQYGDCLVIELGGLRILIDGGHPGQQTARPAPATPSIPEQLAEIFTDDDPFSPFRFDLLVVTHCHRDHIGCLPALVADRRIHAEWALVAAEKLGWSGPFAQEAGLEPRYAAALAGWREEGTLRGGDVAIAAMLADALTLEDRYRRMLETLEDRGTRIVRFGSEDLAPFRDRFEQHGLRVVGPTREHLEICSRAIDEAGRRAFESAALAADHGARDAVAIYRDLLSSRELAPAAHQEDAAAGRPGAAVNNQSLVLLLERNGKKALLTGDMQLAEPETGGLATEMTALTRRLIDLGPFDLVKLPHHGAMNGFDQALLEALRCPLLVISTGEGSPLHPHPKILEILQRNEDLGWFRTDRNGRVVADFSGPSVEVGVERNDPRDATLPFDAELAAAAGGGSVPAALPEPEGIPALAPARAAEARLQTGVEDSDWIEVTARIPRQPTRVTFTIEVEPLEPARGPIRKGRARLLAGGPRRASGGVGSKIQLADGLPPLLFVTDSQALERQVGPEATRQALAAIRNSGQQLLDRSFSRMAPQRAAGFAVTAAIEGRVEGVVILGGYQVVPPASREVLSEVYLETDKEHEDGLDEHEDDLDEFSVWSDDHFGGSGDYGLADIPVSRIPDAGSPELLLRALLSARNKKPASRLAIRNARRPFADEIFAGIPGTGEMLVSAPFSSRAAGGLPGADLYYLVLHGEWDDGARYTGEEWDRRHVEAFHRDQVPSCDGAVVFSACCWAALIADARVRDDPPHGAIPGRGADSSIALRFLEQGANAFVGCTGAHYSPALPPFDYGSAPLHSAFFHHLAQGLSPAAALCAAKQDYLAGSPYRVPGEPASGPGAPVSAIERKTLLQFCCLGLGW